MVCCFALESLGPEEENEKTELVKLDPTVETQPIAIVDEAQNAAFEDPAAPIRPPSPQIHERPEQQELLVSGKSHSP
jgi:hypothetical protein